MRHLDRWLSWLSPLVLLAIWEVAARSGWLNPAFFPPPSAIVETALALERSGVLWQHLAATLSRLLLGFAAGALPAVALGLVLGLSRPWRLVVLPIANVLYTIPKIAILPLVLLVLGLGETSKIAITAISVFFLVLLNTTAGVLGIERRYLDVARNFGASRWQVVRTVALPGALPLVLTGCKLGLGFALIVVVGTEFVVSGARTGVGVLLWESWQILNIEAMYVGLVLTALLGWGMNLAVDEVERWLTPWQVSRASAHEEGRMMSWRVWLRATRPFSFTATFVPITLGAALAALDGAFNPWLYLLTLAGATAVHAGANMANDYYDHLSGVDQPDSLGPSGVIQRALLTPAQLLRGTAVAFGIGIVIGLYLVAVAGPAILWLGLVSVPLAFFYTGRPFTFGYKGFGELIVLVFMGPVMVLGSYFVQAQRFDLAPLLVSLPVALLVAAILHANNMRDVEGDRAVGKQTLAALLGRDGATWEYYLLIFGGYVIVLLLALLRIAPPATLLTLLTLPTAVSLARVVAQTHEARTLNVVLRKTAGLHLRFGMLLILGVLAPVALRWVGQ
ncbi:MAG: 1,4-dihydroxy-2-naphthoate octaprenyltransferase [Chloroflexi bacterium]|nr:1,4-dihydroxy-2-naphthoate octaprenyltransferase [Chloroflexota bacterium]